MNLTEYCTGIADAIRTKEGSTEKIPAPDHKARILAIQTGTTPPELTNPAAEEQVLSGYEFIDGEGAKKTGSVPTVEQATPTITFGDTTAITATVEQGAGYCEGGTKTANINLDYYSGGEITPGTEDTQILAAGRWYVENPIVVKAASGGGVDTCTITITGYYTGGNSRVGYVVTRYVDGVQTIECANMLTTAPVTITDVVCGSLLYASGYDVIGVSVGGGVVNVGTVTILPTGVCTSTVSLVFQAPTTAEATGTITFTED